MVPIFTDGVNFNVQYDLGFSKKRLMVKVFLYENHRQTSAVGEFDCHRPPTENTKSGVYEEQKC
jgi:hypothetical protein